MDHSYDREILISWVDCQAYRIISNIFPLPASETDPVVETYSDTESEDKEDSDSSDTEDEESANKKNRAKEAEQPGNLQGVINVAISRIESRQKEDEDKIEAEKLHKSFSENIVMYLSLNSNRMML